MPKQPQVIKALFNPVYFAKKYHCPICKSIVGVSDKKQETILIIDPAQHSCYQQFGPGSSNGKS